MRGRRVFPKRAYDKPATPGVRLLQIARLLAEKGAWVEKLIESWAKLDKTRLAGEGSEETPFKRYQVIARKIESPGGSLIDEALQLGAFQQMAPKVRTKLLSVFRQDCPPFTNGGGAFALSARIWLQSVVGQRPRESHALLGEQASDCARFLRSAAESIRSEVEAT